MFGETRENIVSEGVQVCEIVVKEEYVVEVDETPRPARVGE